MALVKDAACSDSYSQPLYAEWAAANPRTAEEVARFYAETPHYVADLEAWHQLSERQTWTTALIGVAREIGARDVVDIGCGLGHDLLALRDSIPAARLCGVEPNRANAQRCVEQGLDIISDVSQAPIETADLVTSFDVFEHIPDPEAFVGEIARRMRLGSVLIETTATHDIQTPLHLVENQGWHPGRVLERHGFLLLDRQDRFAVWQRLTLQAPPRASLLLVAYRTCSIPTMSSILNLAGVAGEMLDDTNGVRLQRMTDSPWRIRLKWGDGLIPRGRSIAVSRWWAETADDVALMLDDDITFSPDDANRLVELCRAGHDVICAGYPIGDAEHLAIRGLDGGEIEFKADAEPLEIRWAATGFLAFSRRVIDVMMPTLPWLHADRPHAYKALFQTRPYQMGATTVELSEDWDFCQRARDLGFRVWLDPTIRLKHQKMLDLTVGNMPHVRQAIAIARAGG